MHNSILVFRILLFIPIGSFLENMFGKQILLNIGKDRFYFNVFLVATLCNIGLNLYLTSHYSYIGTAVALTATQLIIDIGLYYYARREINGFARLEKVRPDSGINLG
jgi:PST family polysaccharide transporter